MTFSDVYFQFYALVLVCSLIVLTFIDLDTQLLPDSITLPLLWCGLLVNLNGFLIPLHSAVLGAVLGYISLWTIYWIFKLITGKEGLGYGDFKLMAALGAWFGIEAIPVLTLLSSIFGILIYIIMWLLKKRDNGPIAFGPYLAISGGILLFFHSEFIYFLTSSIY